MSGQQVTAAGPRAATQRTRLLLDALGAPGWRAEPGAAQVAEEILVRLESLIAVDGDADQ